MQKKYFSGAFMCLVISLLLILNGCKKNDIPETQTSEIGPSSQVPQEVRESWKKEGYSATYLLNKKIDAMFIDENGSEKKFSNARLLATCDAEDDDFVDNAFYMQAQQVGYSCEGGYTVQVNYAVITAFTPVAANPSNPSQLSRGRFRLKDGSGNVIYTNSSVTPVTITYVGPDLFDANKSVYQISYLVTGIPDNYMEASASNENRPIIYSDCSEVITTPVDWQTGVTYGGLDPCVKIDKVYMTPAGSGGNVFFGGCDQTLNTTGTCYPSELLSSRPDEHEIQWRKVGDATYGNWPAAFPNNYSGIGGTSFTQYISYPGSCGSNANLKQLLLFYDAISYHFPVTGTIEIRYRNIRLNSPVSSCQTINCRSDGWVYKTITVI